MHGDTTAFGVKFYTSFSLQELGPIAFIQSLISPQISVTTLNGSAISEYFLLDEKTFAFSALQLSPLSIEFQSDVKIGGNIYTDRSSGTILENISADAIDRLGNERIIIQNTIAFKEHLLVNHITMQTNTSKFVRQSNAVVAVARKNAAKQFMNSFIAHKNIIGPNSSTIQKFNSQTSLPHYMNSLMESKSKSKWSTIMIFERQMNAAVVTVDVDCYFIDNSDHPVRYFDLNNIVMNILNAQKSQIGLLMVDGNVRFDCAANKEINVNIFNGLALLKYLNLAISMEQQNNQKSIEIGGEKTFISEFGALLAHTIEFNNRFQTQEWIEYAFRQQRSQMKVQQMIESSKWQFINMITDNFRTQHSINGIRIFSMDNTTANIIFVDDNPTNMISIASDVSLSNYGKLGFHSELKCTELRPCNIQNFVSDTVHLSQIIWNELNIVGNVKILTYGVSEVDFTQCGLYCFFQKSLSNELDESINLNISFTLESEEKISFNRVIFISSGLQTTCNMNNIDLSKIFIDAVAQRTTYPDENNRLIAFQSKMNLIGIKISCDGIETVLSAEFSTPALNGIYIKQLNDSVFYINAGEILVLSWHKILFLEAPIIKAMNISRNQTINSVLVADFYFVYSQISSISFQKLDDLGAIVVSHEQIHVISINGMPLQFFIDNRSKLYNRMPLIVNKLNIPQIIDGFITFDNLILIGNETKIDQINDIRCDDAVLTYSNEKQHITGYKGTVGQSPIFYVQKPFHTWTINNLEFISKYTKTISLDREHLVERFAIKRPYIVDVQKNITIWKKINQISLEG